MTIFWLVQSQQKIYSESKSDFNFTINSASSDFESTSESGSESESESDFSKIWRFKKKSWRNTRSWKSSRNN